MQLGLRANAFWMIIQRTPVRINWMDQMSVELQDTGV